MWNRTNILHGCVRIEKTFLEAGSSSAWGQCIRSISSIQSFEANVGTDQRLDPNLKCGLNYNGFSPLTSSQLCGLSFSHRTMSPLMCGLSLPMFARALFNAYVCTIGCMYLYTNFSKNFSMWMSQSVWSRDGSHHEKNILRPLQNSQQPSWQHEHAGTSAR